MDDTSQATGEGAMSPRNYRIMREALELIARTDPATLGGGSLADPHHRFCDFAKRVAGTALRVTDGSEIQALLELVERLEEAIGRLPQGHPYDALRLREQIAIAMAGALPRLVAGRKATATG